MTAPELPRTYTDGAAVQAEVAALRQLRTAGGLEPQMKRLCTLIDKALFVERLERAAKQPVDGDAERLAMQLAAIAVDLPDRAHEDLVGVRLGELEAVLRKAITSERTLEAFVRVGILEQDVETWRERARKLLGTVTVRQKRCESCHVELHMVATAVGRLAPFTAEVVNHFVDCPEAAKFRAARRTAGGQA